MNVAGRPRRKVKQSQSSVPGVGGAPHEHADLTAAHLAKANLRARRLRFATMSAANLRGADLSGADLQHAQFNQARLGAADLNDARLDHANFTGADLARATLRGADLRFAILYGARLVGADLSAANAAHARFDGTDLTNANLRDMRLDHAVFAGANLAKANLCGANLRYARNLTSAQIAGCRTDSATILPPRLGEATSGSLPAAARGRSPRPARIVTDRAAAGLTAILVSAAQGIGAGLRNRRVLLLGGLASAIFMACLGWYYSQIEELKPSTAAERLESAFFVPDGLPLATDIAVLPLARRPAAAPIPAPDTLPDVEPQTVAAAPLPPDPVPEPRPQSASLSLDPPPGAKPAGAEALIQPESLRPSLVLLAPARLGIMRPIPLANAKLRAGKMKIVKVALTLQPLAAPEATVALEAPLTIRAREMREEGAALIAPMTVVVSLKRQRLDLYQGTTLLTTSKISSGKPGHETRPGVFSILEKETMHASNIYSGAPMPWMQRLTRSGIALHGGVVPNHPASHGCVRLPMPFASKLFGMTEVGANVVIAEGEAAPRPIEHRTLFQPAPPTAQASLGPDAGMPDLYIGAGSVNAPLRILVARRTKRDELIDAQRLLAKLGYMSEWRFLGQMEGETRTGIMAFQKAHGMPETGKFTPDLASKLYEVTGKERPPAAQLFVRQDFHRLYDLPIVLRDPERKLGTHIFTLQALDEKEGTARWMAISLEGDESKSVLDRIAIPADIRKDISARLTPDSTMIVAEVAEDSPILPEGDDFIVWMGDDKNVTQTALIQEPVEDDVAKPKAKRRAGTPSKRRRDAVPAEYAPPPAFKQPWQYGGW